MIGEFDPQTLGQGGRLAALVPAEAMFSFVNRRIVVPAHCGALTWSDSPTPKLVRGGETIERDGTREILFYAVGGSSVTLMFGPLQSRDGFDCTARLEVELAPHGEAAELAAFRRALLPHPGVLSVDGLATAVRGPLGAALSAFVGGRLAAELVRMADASVVSVELIERVRPELFAIGLAIGRHIAASFASPAWEASQRDEQQVAARKRQAETDVQIRDALAAARGRQLADLEALFARLERLSQQQPGVKLLDLIRTFDPTQRGELYRGLLSIGPEAQRAVSALVVAGRTLAALDPLQPTAPTWTVTLPDAVGALRSVRVASVGGDLRLLVGAATGVHVCDSRGKVVQTYAFKTSAALRGGVNAAAVVGDRLLATHSEVGLISWRLDDPEQPDFPLRDVLGRATRVRDVQADADGRAWLCAEETAITWHPGADAPPLMRRVPSDIGTLRVGQDEVFAGLDDGRILRWPRGDGGRSAAQTVRPPTGDAVQSLSLVTTCGVRRLLVADRRPMLDLLVLDDTHRVEFVGPSALRWGWAHEGAVIAVDDRRDKLFGWSISRPDAEPGAVSIVRLLGHQVQDVALIAGDAPPATA